MLFRSVLRSKAEGRPVKSLIIISSELFTCKIQILGTFCIERKARICTVFLMSVEVIVVNKDAFQSRTFKITPEALTLKNSKMFCLFSIICDLKLYKKVFSCIATS